jgi:hypothetical protein
LREQGFQDKYDEITGHCARILGSNSTEEMFDNLDALAIQQLSRDLATNFDKYFREEVKLYRTSEHGLSRNEAIDVVTDISKEAAGAAVDALVPGSGLVKLALRIPELVVAARAVSLTQVHDNAVTAAMKRRHDEITDVCQRLKMPGQKQAELLYAVAALADIYQIRTRRA